jgi:hypothetical protein
LLCSQCASPPLVVAFRCPSGLLCLPFASPPLLVAFRFPSGLLCPQYASPPLVVYSGAQLIVVLTVCKPSTVGCLLVPQPIVVLTVC